MAAIAAIFWVQGVAASPFALRPGPVPARLEVAPFPLEAAPPGPRILNVGPLRRTGESGRASDLDALAFAGGRMSFPNDNVRQRIDHLGLFTGFTPLRWKAVAGALGRDWPAAARRYGLTHVVFLTPREGSNAVTQVATAGGRILHVDPVLGAEAWAVPHRAWATFPPSIESVPGPAEAVARVAAGRREWATHAVVESDAALPAASGRVLTVERGTEWLRVVAEADADATLLVNDAFWPGWVATLDGTRTEILAADALVRAVRFPAGRHTLVMRYEPRAVGAGAGLSLVGVAALALACLCLRARGPRGPGCP